MPEIVSCPECGKETYEGVARCPHCGHVFNEELAKSQIPRSMSWFRRGSAFLADLALVGLAWSLLNNVIAFPMPAALSILGLPVTFCLYFLLAETIGKRAASPGKRLFSIELVQQQTDGRPPAREIAVRAVFLSIIITMDWERLLFFLPAQTPEVAGISIVSLALGLTLYNGLLAIIGPGRAMLQDIWTRTAVVYRNRERSEIAPAEPIGGPSPERILWPKPALAIMTTLVVFAGDVALYGFQAGGTSLAEKLISPLDRGQELALESRIATDLGLRASVEIVEHYKNFEPEPQRLEITVWLPFVSFSQENANRVAEWIAQALTVPPGRYESGSLSVGFRLAGPVGVSSELGFTLEMP